MKKVVCSIFALLILLCGCSHNSQSDQPYTDTPSNDNEFIRDTDGNIVSASGDVYAWLTSEGFLYYLGELEFVGSIQGEEKTSEAMGCSYQTGMFAAKGSDNNNILIRRPPNDEWFHIYRKTSLPSFDFSVDNCIRLELVFENRYWDNDAIHTTCGDGIADASEIAKFLSDIRSQKDPHEAGLYDLVTKPDGMYENCYVYGAIYGFFEEDPNLVTRMEITSYNDLAYSISIEGKEYVLPTEWLQKLENK